MYDYRSQEVVTMQSHLARVAVSQLNQWALDFSGNLKRIKASIRAAKRAGALYRTGPELEMCGYSCEDHFLEPDTIDHCWRGLLEILDDDELTYGILVDIGMPVQFGSARYNCRVFCLNGSILLIRPKTALANDGNFREGRYFAAWNANDLTLYDFPLTSLALASGGGPPMASPNGAVNGNGGTAAVAGAGAGGGGGGGVGAGPTVETQPYSTQPYSTQPYTHMQSFSSSTSAPGPLGAPSALSTAPSAFSPPSFLAVQQSSCKFGLGVIQCDDAVLGVEICEEIWTPQAMHVAMTLDGVDIISNSSGSHHEFRKLETRIKLVTSATFKCGGAYLYSNLIGCDGGRLYFDGASFVAVNGVVTNMASGFSVGKDVEVLISTLDLAAIRAHRSKIPSLQQQAAFLSTRFGRVKANIALTSWNFEGPSRPLEVVPLPAPEEEIALAPSCWLWDYLRRSGAGGFFLPLSGGADSAAVATIVGVMCQRVMEQVASAKSEPVIRDLESMLRMTRSDPKFPKTHQEMANLILHSAYLRSENSSDGTRALAGELAAEIGAYHVNLPIDAVVAAFLAVIATLLNGVKLRFAKFGGSRTEDLALQNLQARIRMVFAYLLAAILPWIRRGGGQQSGSSSAAPAAAAALPAAAAPGAAAKSSPVAVNQATSSGAAGKQPASSGGALLVLASGNVDESLRGYMTKYDCSSGDLNPIGSISKVDLKVFIAWAGDAFGYPALKKIVEAPPTAELQPLGAEQTDEADMGISYADLSYFGRLRKVARCGPLTMFRSLLFDSAYKAETLANLAASVKHFFRCYAANRHKMTTLTPSLHTQGYSADDNRFDLRPFLYPDFSAQFEAIDRLAEHVSTMRAQRAR